MFSQDQNGEIAQLVPIFEREDPRKSKTAFMGGDSSGLERILWRDSSVG